MLIKTPIFIKTAIVACMLLAAVVVLLSSGIINPKDTWKSGATIVTLSKDGTLKVRARWGISVSYWRHGIWLEEITIRGRGAMRDYNLDDPVWHGLRNRITAVVFEEGVTHIGTFAFREQSGEFCQNLTSITIPYSVTSIGAYAFDGCDLSLASVTVLNPIPPHQMEQVMGSAIEPNRTCQHIMENSFYIDDRIFMGAWTCDRLADSIAYIRPTCLYVPANSITAYRSADGWKDFECIEAIDVAAYNSISNSNGYDNNKPVWTTFVEILLWISYYGLLCFSAYGFILSACLLPWFVIKKIYRGESKNLKILLKVLSILFTMLLMMFLIIVIFFVIIAEMYCPKGCMGECLYGVPILLTGLFLTLARQCYQLYKYYIKKTIKRPTLTIILTICHFIIFTILIIVRH